MSSWSGKDDGWRYLAYRITGNGHEGPQLVDELPLSKVQITDVLSGPPLITGNIDPPILRLKGPGGQPLLDEWSTGIYAEQDGQIVDGGAGIYQSGVFDGPQWQLNAAGFASYPQGMGYEGEPKDFIQADPLDITRFCWSSLQAGLDSNLGMVVDSSTKTPVRVGTVDTPDSGTDGPFSINEWSTPFDYRERHAWNQRHDRVAHSLQFGYPKIGRRRHDLTFVLGQNIRSVPRVTRDGSKFANHVRFLGAGEGRDMVRREARKRDGRLRRMATVDDKSVTGPAHAARRAGRELAARQLRTTISDVACWDTPDARLGKWGPGDEILVQGEVDYMDVEQWCRVITLTKSPENPEIIGMSLLPSELA